MNFNEWKRANPDQCVGPGVNYAWNRYMDSLAPTRPPADYDAQISKLGLDPKCFRKTVTTITQAPAPIADTSIVEQRNTTGVKHMFTSRTFETNLTTLIAAATLAAFLASLVA